MFVIFIQLYQFYQQLKKGKTVDFIFLNSDHAISSVIEESKLNRNQTAFDTTQHLTGKITPT